MILPLNFISDYVNTDGLTPSDIQHRMTGSGTIVDTYTCLGEKISNVFTGKVLSVDKHPNADKLVVCKVSLKGNTLQIITGATNVNAGDIVPVAVDGAVLPEKTIKTGKMRGELSEGMLCSDDELFPTHERADGILILPPDTPLDADIRDVLGLWDATFDFDVMPNRPDCLSVVGIAREVAATYKRDFIMPERKYATAAENASGKITVEIRDYKLCKRYSARVVRNVKVAPSPDWLVHRLQDCGLNAINNIVDITNYVMLEYGQPLHAFDMRFIDKGIIVRRADDGEVLTALDGKPYTLTPDTLVIADHSKPLALAGIMGGEYSGIKDDTTEILLESALFDYANIRQSSKRLGLRTDASSRFEKGLDVQNTVAALDRVCELIEQLCCGEILGGTVDVHAPFAEPTTLPFEPQRVNAILGTHVSDADMLDILSRVGIAHENGTLTVPSWRGDVTDVCDIAEEVARFAGYDLITATMPKTPYTSTYVPPVYDAKDAVRRVLGAYGYNETLTMSWVGVKQFDLLRLPSDDARRNAVPLLNPQGEESAVMRTTLLPSVLQVMSHNARQQIPSWRCFECAATYHYSDGKDATPVPGYVEHNALVIAGYGDGDFFTLKGAIEQLLRALGIDKYDVEREESNPSYHSGQCAKLLVRKQVCGVFGTLHPLVAKAYDLPHAYAAELDLDKLCAFGKATRSFKPLPKYPSATRDIAVLVADSVDCASILQVITKTRIPILEDVKLFDVYAGKGIAEGEKSMAFSLRFRHDERTLTDDEMDQAVKRIIDELGKKLKARLRA